MKRNGIILIAIAIAVLALVMASRAKVIHISIPHVMHPHHPVVEE